MTVDPSASPAPSSGAYNPEQAARNAAVNQTGTRLQGVELLTYGTGNAPGQIKKTKSNDFVFGNYTFQFDPAQGYVAAVSNDPNSSGSTVQDTSFLADPKNSNAIMIGVNGNLLTSAEAANRWIMENTNSPKIEQIRNLLIAKGWIAGDSAKLSVAYGPIGDQILAKALTTAITEISWRNLALKKSGSDALTLEQGIRSLVKVDTTQVSTDVQKQDFLPADYRSEVDKVFMETRGRGATEQELNMFVKTLENMQAKNPRVTTTVKKGDNTTTTTRGGVSAEAASDALQTQALKSPEAEDYQKATTYMSWFNEAIDSGINLND